MIALALVEVGLPYLNELLSRNLDANLFSNWKFTAGIILIALTVSLFSGGYIALFISRLNPAEIIGRNKVSRIGGMRLQKSLIFIQLVIFSGLIFGTLVINKQIYFVKNTNMGFNDENVVLLQPPMNGEFSKVYEAYKSEIMRHPDILQVTGASIPPHNDSRAIVQESTADNPTERVMVEFYSVDYDYFETLEAELLAGRTFSREFGDESKNVILNEAAVKALNLGDDAVGTLLAGDKTVIGVVKDFHTHSFRHEIAPTVIGYATEWVNCALIRIRGTDMGATLEHIKNEWEKTGTPGTYEISFLDQTLDALYEDEQRFEKMVRTFTLLAILLSSLGLFGITLLVAQQRTKEIGIRKVMGASVSRLVGMLSREYVLLALVASIVSWPIAFLAVSKWLDSFVYKTDIDLFVYAGSAALAVAIVWSVVSYHAFRASAADPVKTLRYE